MDPRLFRRRSYTAGVILAAVGVLAMIGVLFTMPQYFQGVRATDAVGSGLRLMPVIGGLIVGTVSADRLADRIGRKITLAGGFALLAAGLSVGAQTTVTSSVGFVTAWMALAGAGLGLVVATSTSAALSELDSEHSGIGSAVLQAVNKTGAPFGAAILGSVLLAGYRSGVDLHHVPPGAADLVRTGIFGGIATAQRLHLPELAASVRFAFTAGIDASLWVCAGIAAAGMVVALLLVPPRADPAATAYSDREHIAV